jgi:hypothetical protein
MSRISGQVEGCKPAYNDDKDRKMDEEAAQRRLCEPKLLRLRPCSFRHRRTPARLRLSPLEAASRCLGSRSPLKRSY